MDNALALDKQAGDAQIAAVESSQVRAIASAQQELQIARSRAAAQKQIDDSELAAHLEMLRRKGAAESVGKDSQQRATVQTSIRGEIDTAIGDNARKQIQLDANVAAAAAKVGQVRATAARESKVELDQLVRESQNLLDRNTAQLEEAQERLADIRQQANVRVEETQAKGGGELQQLQIQAQKLQLERQYGLEIGHTLAQQIQQEAQLAELDAKGREAKIAGLQAQMQIADAAQKEAAARSGAAILTGDTKEATRAGEQEVRNKEKVADIQAQIDEAREQANNADIEAQIKLGQLRNQQSIRHEIGSDVFRAGQQAPGAIGGALAKGIIDGKGIGRDIRDSLRGVGQELLGQVFKQAITELVVKLGITAAAQAVLGTVFATGTTAQATATAANTAGQVVLTTALGANTLALAANTTAVGAGAAVKGVGVAAGAASKAASAAAGAASTVASAATGFIGQLGGLIGGIAGGVISGLFAMAAANKVVAAVHGTTAAVLSLKTVTVGDGATSQSSGAPVKEDSGPGIFARIFGPLTTNGAMKVNVVAVSPLAPLTGLLSLFGFAEGGRPPVGVPSIIGEKGPELWVPDQAGVIIPAGTFNVSQATAASQALPGLPGAAGLSPNINLAMPQLGLPSQDATLNRVPAPSQRTATASDGTVIHLHGAQFYGVQDAREMMRKISQYAKTSSPRFSPYSR